MISEIINSIIVITDTCQINSVIQSNSFVHKCTLSTVQKDEKMTYIANICEQTCFFVRCRNKPNFTPFFSFEQKFQVINWVELQQGYFGLYPWLQCLHGLPATSFYEFSQLIIVSFLLQQQQRTEGTKVVTNLHSNEK
jgi:hypothetical protein